MVFLSGLDLDWANIYGQLDCASSMKDTFRIIKRHTFIRMNLLQVLFFFLSKDKAGSMRNVNRLRQQNRRHVTFREIVL